MHIPKWYAVCLEFCWVIQVTNVGMEFACKRGKVIWTEWLCLFETRDAHSHIPLCFCGCFLALHQQAAPVVKKKAGAANNKTGALGGKFCVHVFLMANDREEVELGDGKCACKKQC